MKNVIALISLIGLTSGCASNLSTFDSKGNKTQGIPIASPILVEITSVSEFKVAPGAEHASFSSFCINEENSAHAFLPLGEVSYVGFDPSSFSKGEFKVEFTDSGSLKSVSLNSEANSGVDSVTGLISSVLPFVAAPKVTPDARVAVAVPAADLKSLHCLKTGTKIKSVKRLAILP